MGDDDDGHSYAIMGEVATSWIMIIKWWGGGNNHNIMDDDSIHKYNH
jgi:hypothetical protein